MSKFWGHGLMDFVFHSVASDHSATLAFIQRQDSRWLKKKMADLVHVVHRGLRVGWFLWRQMGKRPGSFFSQKVLPYVFLQCLINSSTGICLDFPVLFGFWIWWSRRASASIRWGYHGSAVLSRLDWNLFIGPIMIIFSVEYWHAG